MDLIDYDHRSRSVLLLGDSGAGKSYLLSRLKCTLNSKAFFAYIDSWADSDYIWRHTLRYTVDSLTQVPEGQQESQLMLWLKSLSAFTKRSLKQQIFNDSIWQILQSDRQKFIKHLKDTYRQASIYNPDIFFGVLHELTNPELYSLACEWLRGDLLSEESMNELRVKYCIDSEDAAKNILANFGRISTETQPIVLCFDNLDNIPRLPDGSQDFQALFNINTTIHNNLLKNFLVIISVITNTWNRNSARIQQADRARLDKAIRLKPINLEQAQALWAYRLQPIHQLANPQTSSSIFPLTRQVLEEHFPGGKTLPRNTLLLGRREYQAYKEEIFRKVTDFLLDSAETQDIQDKVFSSTEELETDKKIAEFQLLWQEEYQKIQAKITKITLLSATELIKMLQEALEALQVKGIQPKLLTGRYASYSLSYQHPSDKERIGVVWTEDSNMNAFFNVMNACQRTIQQNLCQTLYLVRAGGVGTSRLQGNQIYRHIFTHTNHRHIKPILSSVHYLAAYHRLVNSALARELVVAGKAISLEELQAFIQNSKLLQKCTLLQDLGIVTKPANDKDIGNGKTDFQPVKEFLLNLVKTQGYMGVTTLIHQAQSKFSNVNELEIQQIIQELCHEQKTQIINPKANMTEQLICLVAKS